MYCFPDNKELKSCGPSFHFDLKVDLTAAPVAATM